MNWTLCNKTIESLFILKSGNIHAVSELDSGTVPLISCGDADNGLVGYFDVPPEKRFKHRVTVAYNGLPLLAKFHPYEFGAKDDVAVLIPRTPMRNATLLYVAATLNGLAWRYSYGRKCYRAKLYKVQIPIPVLIGDVSRMLNEDVIASFVTPFISKYLHFVPQPDNS